MKLVRTEESKKCGIYIMRNIINNKIYVGSAKNFYNRFHSHRNKLRKNKHPNSYLQNSYNKYKEESFIFEIIEYCEIENRFIREQYYIDTLKPQYNQDLFVYPVFHSKEKRKRISNTLKEGYKSGRIINPSFRKVKVFDLNGNYLYTFNTIRECCKTLNIGISSVNRCLTKVNKRIKEYQIRYIEDEDPGILETYPSGITIRKDCKLNATSSE